MGTVQPADTLLGRASASGDTGEAGALAKAVEARERGLLTGAALLGALVLVVWTRPTGLVVLLIVAVTLLVMGAVRVLAEIARRAERASSSEPDGDGPPPSASPSPPIEDGAADDDERASSAVS